MPAPQYLPTAQTGLSFTTDVRALNSSLNAYMSKFYFDKNRRFKEILKALVYAIWNTNPVETGRSSSSWQIAHVALGGQLVTKGSNRRQGIIQGFREGIFYARSVLLQLTEVTFGSSTPYIWALEQGHSKKQAPQGMVRVNLNQVSQLIAQALATDTEIALPRLAVVGPGLLAPRAAVRVARAFVPIFHRAVGFELMRRTGMSRAVHARGSTRMGRHH